MAQAPYIQNTCINPCAEKDHGSGRKREFLELIKTPVTVKKGWTKHSLYNLTSQTVVKWLLTPFQKFITT